MIKVSILNVIGASLLFATTAMAQTANEVSASKAALCADAGTRNSSAGHDSNGFFVGGSDGARLNIGGDVQFRYTFDYNRKGGEDSNTGFNNPLIRLRFNGNVNEQIDFMLEGGFDRQEGNATLLDSYVGVRAFGGRFQVGQFKLPFMKEVSIADRYQLAADRSIMSYVFGQGRSQGVQFSYNFGQFNLVGAVSDGFNTLNTEYTDPRESDFAATVRGEYVIMGSSDSFNQFTSSREQENSLLAGAAFHYQEGSDQNTMYTYTGDLTWKNHGWNAFVSGVGRNTEDANTSYNDLGFAVQGGYRVTDQFEPFARYDSVFADSSRGFSNNDFNFITAGVNYYLCGHTAKFTLDAVYSLDNTTGLSSMSNFSDTGLLGSTDSGEVSFRMQFQLLF